MQNCSTNLRNCKLIIRGYLNPVSEIISHTNIAIKSFKRSLLTVTHSHYQNTPLKLMYFHGLDSEIKKIV